MISHGIEALRGQGARIVTTGVPTATVMASFRAGEGVGGLADQYDLRHGQVEDAIRFELCRSSRRKADAWARKLWEAGR